MQLQGFARTCACRSGGVKSIRLARAADLETAGEVRLRDGKQFVGYDFAEQSASYTEEALRKSGATILRHTLTFAVAPAADASARLLGELEETSRTGGLVALVETSAGETILVGYSKKFGVEHPLRVVSSKGTTGMDKAENSLRTITLQSTDCDPALPVAGI